MKPEITHFKVLPKAQRQMLMLKFQYFARIFYT